MNTKIFFDVIESQLEIVMALEDQEVTETAKELSYYVAMLDAAEDDPMEDQDRQDVIVAVLKHRIQELTEQYQQLVNERI